MGAEPLKFSTQRVGLQSASSGPRAQLPHRGRAESSNRYLERHWLQQSHALRLFEPRSAARMNWVSDVVTSLAPKPRSKPRTMRNLAMGTKAWWASWHSKAPKELKSKRDFAHLRHSGDAASPSLSGVPQQIPLRIRRGRVGSAQPPFFHSCHRHSPHKRGNGRPRQSATGI